MTDVLSIPAAPSHQAITKHLIYSEPAHRTPLPKSSRKGTVYFAFRGVGGVMDQLYTIGNIVTLDPVTLTPQKAESLPLSKTEVERLRQYLLDTKELPVQHQYFYFLHADPADALAHLPQPERNSAARIYYPESELRDFSINPLPPRH